MSIRWTLACPPFMSSPHCVIAMASAGMQSELMGIKELVDSGLQAVPPIYVLPPHDRPDPTLVPTHQQPCIPVIDLAHLHNHDAAAAAARATLIRELSLACEEWGFFQVINHGIEAAVIQRLQEAALKFFMQPAQERMRWFNPSLLKPVNYTISFNPSQEKVRLWKDGLAINRFPGIFDGIQEAPDICKKEMQEYIGEVEALARRLYRLIFESVGLDDEYIEKEVPGIPREILSINYYPPCPDPTLTLGVSGHSDVSCLTILHPGDVPGLQIKHEGSWVPVFPVEPSAFIVNLADQIEILTNGKYKSIEHRAVTNREKARMSIACFFGPMEDTIVAPLPKLLNENNPPQYKPTKFKDYNKNFLSNSLRPNRGSLDFARV